MYPLKLSNPLSKSIVLKYWGYIIKLPMSFFETRKTGEITSKFSNANTLIEVLGET
ncbi:ABC transporter transmembrane domain-containing protein [Ligilactobacillus ruminis]|uniref:ABC transporter transmembrane domain-containing protein n=1 Tax=Ligilactobacillus ruminis TaxID=1623 RepID=UPI0030811CDE